MTTGDVEGNLNRLLQELRLVRFPVDVDEIGLRLGDPISCLHVLHYSLLDYSSDVAALLLQRGFELRGKTDKKFTDAVFRVMRDVLHINPVLTAQQMLQQGFAERKLILLSTVAEKCRSLHGQLSKQKKLQNLKICQRRASLLPKPPSNRGPRIEKACRDEAPLTVATGKWLNTNGDKLPSTSHRSRWSDLGCSECHNWKRTDADSEDSLIGAGWLTEDHLSPCQKKPEEIHPSRGSEALSQERSPTENCQSDVSWISLSEKQSESDSSITGAKVQSSPGELIARNPHGIRPQTRQKRKALSIQKSPKEASALTTQLEELQLRMESLASSITHIQNELSTIQTEHETTSGQQESGCVALKEVVSRLGQLETRMKFLESDKETSTLSANENRKKTTTLVTIPCRAKEHSHLQNRPSDLPNSPPSSLSCSRVEDIIAELSLRQHTAENFLKEHRHSNHL